MTDEQSIDQEVHDNGSGWYAKMTAWATTWPTATGPRPHWLDQLTPAEKLQCEAEERWAARAYVEDLPGPVRIHVIVD
ncbi:hypothetical protein [Taklimakanibacter deserti]|uniref:hypothetical protein n=1 Tax=Taklimakanibacter deserti TaxID=2267839 RepID=UPI000E64D397